MSRPTATPDRRRAGKAQTRDRLLHAAIDVLIEEGYPGFSMNKVAKRAGIAQPSFYAHFENTDQLLDALADDLLLQYLKPIQQSVLGAVKQLQQADARPLLERLFRMAFAVVKSQQALVRMVWAEREQPVSHFGGRLRDLFQQIKVSWAQVLVDIGLVPDSPANQLRLQLFMDGAFALFECYAGLWMDGRYDNEQALAAALTDYVLHFWRDEISVFFAAQTAHN